MGGDEQSIATQHPKVRIVRLSVPEPDLIEQLVPWLRATRTLSDSETKVALARWVREYRPAADATGGGARQPEFAASELTSGLVAGHAEPPAVRP